MSECELLLLLLLLWRYPPRGVGAACDALPAALPPAAADGAAGGSVGGIPMSSSDKAFGVANALGNMIFACVLGAAGCGVAGRAALGACSVRGRCTQVLLACSSPGGPCPLASPSLTTLLAAATPFP